MPTDYPGRNSPRDVRNRINAVEQTSIPSLQQELDEVRSDLENELDIPDVVLLFNAALT